MLESAGIRRSAFLELRTLTSHTELSNAASEWRRLVEYSGPAINEFEWYESAARIATEQAMGIRILTLWGPSGLVAVAPLVLVDRATGPRLELLGSRALYEPAEILARDSDAADRMAAEILALGFPVLLARLPTGGFFSQHFSRRARVAGLAMSPQASGSPFVDLESGWEDYYRGLSSRTRNMLRRGSKALGKLGKVEIEFNMPSAEVLPDLLERALEVELRSWKRRAGSAVLQRKDLREFFRHFSVAAATRREIVISLLKLEGEPIAMQVAHVSRGAYRQLKIGYDERQSKYLPGLQLQLETLRWSFEQGLDSYEFLGTEEPWIREWTENVRECRTWLFYPFNLRGAGAFLQDGLERVRRRLWGRPDSQTKREGAP